MSALGLVLDWKASLGYRFDPFDASILKQDVLLGLDDLKERFNLWLIKGGQLGTIAADKGMGKSMFLRWVETELAPKKSHQQLCLDARVGGTADDLRKMIGARHGIFSKFLPGKVKDDNELLARLAKQQNVILIDNAGGLHKDALALLGQILDKTPSHAVLSDTPERLAKLDLPAKDGLSLRIGKYAHDDLRAILTARINTAGVAGTHPFDEQELTHLLKEAEGNPTQLFKAARERAIELSLKSGKGPAAVATAPTPSAPAQKKRFISIRIAKGTQTGKQESQRSAAPVVTSTAADADALREIVAENERPAPVSAPKSAQQPALTAHEIALFDELASKAPAQKPARKKAAKKAKRR